MAYKANRRGIMVGGRVCCAKALAVTRSRRRAVEAGALGRVAGIKASGVEVRWDGTGGEPAEVAVVPLGSLEA
eukprot:8075227-Lingulodinium_polyedra.AAC.1